MLSRYDDSLEQTVAFAVRVLAFHVTIGVLFLRGPIASVLTTAVCFGLGEPLAVHLARRCRRPAHEQSASAE